MDQQQIGRFIQERRRAHDLTQQALADRLGVTNKAVSKWELGRSMPDVALFEPLCRELEISIPELLAGHRIEAEDRQRAAEELLMESISTRKLIGLSVYLQLNSVISTLLVLSPFLFRPMKPLNILLVIIGLAESFMTAYFEITLPGQEARSRSLFVRFFRTVGMFVTLAVINYPSSLRAGVPLSTFVLTFLIPCLLCLAVNYVVWRRKKG